MTEEYVVVNILANTADMDAKVKGITNNLKGLEQKALKPAVRGFSDFALGMRKNVMGMLSMVFFGRMMQQTFNGLLQPVMDAFGVFDLFSETLLMLFLPVMEAIFPYLLSLMQFFMNLPDPIKMVIGVLTVLGSLLGSFLMILGPLGWGFDVLMKMFPGLSGALSNLGGILTGISTTFLAFAAIVVAIAIGIWLAWQENFGKIRDWVEVIVEGIKKAWEGIGKVFGGIIDVIKALFSGDSKGIVKGFKKIIDGLLETVGGLAMAILGIVVTIGLGMIKFTLNVMKALGGLALDIGKWAIDTGITIVTKIVEGIKSIGSKIFEALKSAAGSFWNVLSGAGGGKTTVPKQNDFIWRSGQGAIGISPDDNIVGTKSGAGVGGGNITLNNTYYVTVSDKAQFERMLADHDQKQVTQLRNLVRFSA